MPKKIKKIKGGLGASYVSKLENKKILIILKL